jgi:hypothetical protein
MSAGSFEEVWHSSLQNMLAKEANLRFSVDARMYPCAKARLSLFKYRFNINDDIDFIADDNTAAVQSSSVVEWLPLSSLALSAFFGCALFFVVRLGFTGHHLPRYALMRSSSRSGN